MMAISVYVGQCHVCDGAPPGLYMETVTSFLTGSDSCQHNTIVYQELFLLDKDSEIPDGIKAELRAMVMK